MKGSDLFIREGTCLSFFYCCHVLCHNVLWELVYVKRGVPAYVLMFFPNGKLYLYDFEWLLSIPRLYPRGSPYVLGGGGEERERERIQRVQPLRPDLLLLYFFTTLSSQWNFSHRKFGLLSPRESQLRQSRVTQPTVRAWCFSVFTIPRTLTWTTGSLTCAQM